MLKRSLHYEYHMPNINEQKAQHSVQKYNLRSTQAIDHKKLKG